MHYVPFILCSSHYYFFFFSSRFVPFRSFLFFEVCFRPFCVCNIFNFRLRFPSFFHPVCFFVCGVFYWNEISLDATFYHFVSHQVFRGAFDVFLSLAAMAHFCCCLSTNSLLACVNDLRLCIWKDESATVNFAFVFGLSFSSINNVNDYCCCSWCRYSFLLHMGHAVGFVLCAFFLIKWTAWIFC